MLLAGHGNWRAVQILNSEVPLTSKSPEIKFGSVDYFGIGEPFAWVPCEAWVSRRFCITRASNS
jgi:hypothetical protein